MEKSKYVVFFFLQLVITENAANNVFRELSKNPKNPSYFIQMLRSPAIMKNQFALNNTRIKSSSSDTTVIPHVKHQPINRVSQKQFEVINMLWRKTKIFVDIEPTTATYVTKQNIISRRTYNTEHRNPFQISLLPPMAQISTPSYIEFYYIHEIDDRVKEKKSPNFNIDIRIAATSRIKNNTDFVRNKLYGFNNYNIPVITPYPPALNRKLADYNQFKYYADFFSQRPHKHLNSALIRNDIKKANPRSETTFELFGNETCPYTTTPIDDIYSENKTNSKGRYTKSLTFRRNMKSPEENEIAYERILLEHVDSNNLHISKHNKTKHSKKHIDINESKCAIRDGKCERNPKCNIHNIEINNSTESLVMSNNELNAAYTNHKIAYNYVNNSVPWSEYRFVAVYVYEPLQVHCDAAGISPHWLITSGSCLARHHKNPGGEGLSAYVTYCGDSWWNPERVSYVKYSLVHPKYHPRNKIRRHLYNIGIIQVVNSMVSACPGWSPVSLMSHHFSSSSDGLRGRAIGWGLDRFDARYIVTDLPKKPLMMYEALVYSNSCPGNIGYSKAKHLEDEGGVKNVYCLSLPPYNGEENDPVHGALLLVGEKLIALYLQEERRPWGEQSALYTGTWRLVPWVLDNARESEESDIFTVDI